MLRPLLSIAASALLLSGCASSHLDTQVPPPNLNTGASPTDLAPSSAPTATLPEDTATPDAPQWERGGEYSYELTMPSGVRVATYQPGYMGIGAEETRVLEMMNAGSAPTIELNALQDCSVFLPYCRADISISTPTVSSAGLSYFVAASGLASVDSVSLWYRIIRPSDTPGSFIAFQAPLTSLGEAAGVIAPYEVIAPKAQSTDWPAERQRALDWAATPTPEVAALVQAANDAAANAASLPTA